MESNAGKKLFTLDIPPELFRLYMSEDSMDRRSLIDIKKGEFSVLQAVYWSDGAPRIVTFNLDRQWIADVSGTSNDQDPNKAKPALFVPIRNPLGAKPTIRADQSQNSAA